MTVGIDNQVLAYCSTARTIEQLLAECCGKYTLHVPIEDP